jgi:hypothetical protein
LCRQNIFFCPAWRYGTDGIINGELVAEEQITIPRVSAEATKRRSYQKLLARLIDLTRTNNISISLKSFKELSLEELVAIIDDLDPEGKIAGERTQNIKQLLP